MWTKRDILGKVNHNISTYDQITASRIWIFQQIVFFEFHPAFDLIGDLIGCSNFLKVFIL